VLSKDDALAVRAVLIAQARDRAQPVEICCRLGQPEKGIATVLDLCDSERRTVRVTADGFEVGWDRSVRFIRPPGLEALPVPRRGRQGTLRERLQRLFPRLTEIDLFIVAAFLVGSLRATGPYPILHFMGPQGSAKSNYARMVKRIIDPNVADNRSLPSDERDIAIAAQNGWVMSYDNVSKISPWLSDALCRLATGGGFATRKLYTDSEEFLCEYQRPIIINSIGDPAERPDLRDRMLVVHLPFIPSEERETEESIWSQFRLRHADLLGILLQCVAAGFKAASTIKLPRLPRLADFYKFVAAAQPFMGFSEGLLDETFARSQRVASVAALDSSCVARALIEFMKGTGELEASASELADQLRDVMSNDVYFDRRAWPATPRTFANELRRLQPVLLSQGIQIEFDRSGKRRSIFVRRVDVMGGMEQGEGRGHDDDRDDA
jgi:putative DNA primase/helicase